MGKDYIPVVYKNAIIVVFIGLKTSFYCHIYRAVSISTASNVGNSGIGKMEVPYFNFVKGNVNILFS